MAKTDKCLTLAIVSWCRVVAVRGKRLIVGRYEFELLEHNEAPLKLDHATCTLLLKYQKMERECVNGILAFALQCRD